MKFFHLVLWLGLLALIVPCSGDDDDAESKEMEAFMRLMMKSSQKHLKRMVETLDIGSLVGFQCNSSWHQFMSDNELNPEKFSTMIEDYKTGNHEKIMNLVRPEQCLANENGKFCQVDHLTNITMKSKPRVFDLTYALCYPRGCSNDELDTILAAMTDSSKGFMIQIKLNVVKCITSLEHVNKMEIDTVQKMMSKLTSGVNQTLELAPFKLPGSLGSSILDQSALGQANLPKFSFNMPEDISMFSHEDLSSFSTPKPMIQPSLSDQKPLRPTLSPKTLDNPWKSSDSSPEELSTSIITPHPAFKWPETEQNAPEDSNPFRFPEIFFPDETIQSKSTTTESPIDIKQFDQARLQKMIPGLMVQD